MPWSGEHGTGLDLGVRDCADDIQVASSHYLNYRAFGLENGV